MKLRISKGSQTLDLFPKTAFQIDWKSPVFFGDRSPDAIPNLKTYSFRIPDTPHNRLILDRPEMLDNVDELYEENGWEIYFEGKLFLQGTAKITEARNNARGYDFHFIGGLAGGLKELKNKKITDYDYGGDQTFVATMVNHANDVADTPDDYDYGFPPVYLGTNDATGFDYINYHTGTTYKGIDASVKVSTFVPMFRAKFVLEHLISQIGFTLKGLFSTGTYATELNKLIIFNNNSLDTFEEDPVVLEGSPITPKNHIPKIGVNAYLINLLNMFCATPFLDERKKTFTIKANKDLLNADVVDWSNKVTRNYNLNRRIEMPDGLDYIQGDDTTKEFWNNPKSFSTVATIGDLETDTAQFHSVDDYYYVTSQNAIYSKRIPLASPDIEWFPVAQFLSPYNDAGNNIFTLNAGTLFMEPRDSSFPTNWDLSPRWEGGIRHPISGGDVSNDLLFLFWRGEQDALLSETRPLASVDVYQEDDTKMTDADLSLLWNGTYGLYETWWKDWLNKMATAKIIKYSVLLTSTDLEQLDFSKKYKIGNHEHFLKRLQITLTSENISKATCEMVILQ